MKIAFNMSDDEFRKIATNPCELASCQIDTYFKKQLGENLVLISLERSDRRKGMLLDDTCRYFGELITETKDGSTKA